MTDQRLRDLLDDRVSDVVTTDLVAGAWERAARTRRRRTRVALAGAAAAVVAVAGTTVAVTGTGRDSSPPGPSASTSAPQPTGAARPAGEYDGASVWWGPSVEQEPDLPRLAGSGLPSRIDLGAARRPVPNGLRAVGAFEVRKVAYVLTDSRELYRLDIGHLDRIADEGGNVRSPLSEESVSPDGRHLFLLQESSLEVYDLTDGSWTTIDTPDWLAEGARWLSNEEIWVPDRLGSVDSGTASASTARADRSVSTRHSSGTGPVDEPWAR